MPDECVSEMKAKDRAAVHTLLVAKKRASVSEVVDCQKFSSFRRLLNVTALVLRFVKTLKGRTEASGCHLSSTLRPGEIAEAELLWIKGCQHSLAEDRNFEDWKKQIDLFLDQSGLWRCGGRLSHADIPFATKHPILLPKNHHVTSLIVLKAHEKVLHGGVKETLTEMRSRYWVVRGRSLVKMILRRCTTCRRYEGRPCRAPRPPPLPSFRVREEPPFTYTGVDFAGPLHVKGEGKTWIVLYTCCVVRAVHLDLVLDMSTSTFLRSLKRFTARRGLPRKFVSDNGRTFKGPSKVIRAVMEDDDVRVTRPLLSKRMHHLNNILRRFWSRWRQEYLLELREFHRFSSGTSPPTSISIGEVVLIQDDHPRGFWKLGRVEETIFGRDGQVRGAVLRVPSKSGRCTILRRPLQRLYPLEVGCDPGEKAQDAGNAPVSTTPPAQSTPQSCDGTLATLPNRPKRLAASQGLIVGLSGLRPLMSCHCVNGFSFVYVIVATSSN